MFAAAMPQPPTTAAAGNAATVPQKNRPQNPPGKDRLLGVGSLGSRRVVENFHVRRAAGVTGRVSGLLSSRAGRAHGD
jgi:hypothetical protein